MSKSKRLRELIAKGAIMLPGVPNAAMARQVEHIGFDAAATNASSEMWLKNPPLRGSPPIPAHWPAAVESEACAKLHRQVGLAPPVVEGRFARFVRRLSASARRYATLPR